MVGFVIGYRLLFSHNLSVCLSVRACAIPYCHYRKWRIRQRSCGLKPMIRRRLQRKPRMRPVRHDSAVKSSVFDHLALDTRLWLFFWLLLRRDYNHCYSSAIKMQFYFLQNQKKQRFKTTYTPMCRKIMLKLLTPQGQIFAITKAIFI